MKIAIQAADLDAPRIDGTRVYILNLLRHFGEIDQETEFLIYHKNGFNPELTPPDFSNYTFIQKPFPFFWTQTRFAWEIFRKRPDVLWMPMQALPYFRNNSLRTVVTIHDLAFKYFPDFFPRNDLRRLNLFTDYAVQKADRLIAVSASTKNDILKFYPDIKEDKIKMIHHGFDAGLFGRQSDESIAKNIAINPELQATNYLLYVGALQPRKNLEVLIDAFERIKPGFPDLKLVLAGEKAWLFEGIMEKVSRSNCKEDIILTGRVSFDELAALYRGASAFIFPSLYEGFGIPILEAFASKTPVISARNSSLPEVGGDAVSYFDSRDPDDLVEKMSRLLSDNSLKEELVRRGGEQLKKFSWEKCSRETLEFIRSS